MTNRCQRVRTPGTAWYAAVLLLVFAAAAGVAPGTAAARDIPDFTPEQMGGTLRRCISSEPQNLNPITGKDLYERYVNAYVFEGLLTYNLDSGEYEGVLAKSWDVSEDGKTITFHLYPEAHFSDGHPVTAEDVVFSYNTVMNPQVDARSAASYLSDCESCEAVDEHTVRFRWKKKYFMVVGSAGNIFPILPKHLYEKNVEVDPEKAKEAGITHFNNLVQAFVGSGPYRFEKWTAGTEITLVRNERYWGKPRAFDRVSFRIITDERASWQQFKAGNLDYLAVTPEWWLKIKGYCEKDKVLADALRMYKYDTPANGYTYIGWNEAKYEDVAKPSGEVERVERPHPLFSDWRVRRAMTHLLARKTILKYIYHEIGTVATGPFWPMSPQSAPDITPWPYDRREAMRLLAEAGWQDRDNDGWLENEDGEPFRFAWTLPGGHQQTLDLVRVVKEEFRRAGIDVEARFLDWPVFITKLDNRDFDAVTLAWGGSGAIEGDPYQIWHSDAIADQGHNFISFRNARADELIIEARSEMDRDRRLKLWHEFHHLLHDVQPYTFFIARQSLALVSSRMQNVKVHKLGMDSEEWWIAPDRR